jgi:hypothetical protein
MTRNPPWSVLSNLRHRARSTTRRAAARRAPISVLGKERFTGVRGELNRRSLSHEGWIRARGSGSPAVARSDWSSRETPRHRPGGVGRVGGASRSGHYTASDSLGRAPVNRVEYASGRHVVRCGDPRGSLCGCVFPPARAARARRTPSEIFRPLSGDPIVSAKRTSGPSVGRARGRGARFAPVAARRRPATTRPRRRSRRPARAPSETRPRRRTATDSTPLRPFPRDLPQPAARSWRAVTPRRLSPPAPRARPLVP